MKRILVFSEDDLMELAMEAAKQAEPAFANKPLCARWQSEIDGSFSTSIEVIEKEGLLLQQSERKQNTLQ